LLVSITLLFGQSSRRIALLSARQLNWSSFAVGISIVGVEVGYLAAYRAGWNLNRDAIFSNTAVAVLLVPLGLLLFKENLTPRAALGIALCAVGLLLLVQR
jgi:uncharacterized membrane protein